jgi:hypothetical protein
LVRWFNQIEFATRERKNLQSTVVSILVLVGMLAFFGGFLASRFFQTVAIPHLRRSLIDATVPMRLAVVIAMFIGAKVLFWVKKEHLKQYARAEMVFATLGCYAALVSKTPSIFSVITVIGGAIYVLIRSFQNMEDAKQQNN